MTNCFSLPRTWRFQEYGTFHFKTEKNPTHSGISWSLVKTMVRYAMLKENHKAQPERSKPWSWGQGYHAKAKGK